MTDSAKLLVDLTTRIDRLWSAYIGFSLAIIGAVFLFERDFGVVSSVFVCAFSLFLAVLNAVALRSTFTACAALSEQIKYSQSPSEKVLYEYSGGRFSYGAMANVVFFTHAIPVIAIFLALFVLERSASPETGRDTLSLDEIEQLREHVLEKAEPPE